MMTMMPEMKRCYEACAEARQACMAAVRYCLSSGKTMDSKFMLELMNCAQLCCAMEELCKSGKPGKDCCSQVAEACYKACQTSAKLCLEKDGPEMIECAGSCRSAAECCQKLCVPA